MDRGISEGFEVTPLSLVDNDINPQVPIVVLPHSQSAEVKNP